MNPGSLIVFKSLTFDFVFMCDNLSLRSQILFKEQEVCKNLTRPGPCRMPGNYFF